MTCTISGLKIGGLYYVYIRDGESSREVDLTQFVPSSAVKWVPCWGRHAAGCWPVAWWLVSLLQVTEAYAAYFAARVRRQLIERLPDEWSFTLAEFRSYVEGIAWEEAQAHGRTDYDGWPTFPPTKV